MKEIFEVDLQGSHGSTIKNIISVSKHVEPLSAPTWLNDGEERITYGLEVELHNGSTERVKFENINYIHFPYPEGVMP